MSFAIALSRCIVGGDAICISVEVHISNGLPSFTIVGLPETAVRESRDRVRSALLNSGFEFPQRRLTVNLAPGDIPKEGTRFDLAIAIGILAASSQVPVSALESVEFVAELALDGKLRSARASLAAAIGAAEAGRELIVSPADAEIAAMIKHACVRGAHDLRAVGLHLNGSEHLDRQINRVVADVSQGLHKSPDLSEVQGQIQARRSLEIAACGGHNLLLIGPPGTGKSMLAARLPGLLPPLSDHDAMAVAALQSIAGQTPDPARWRERPFRAPHHSSSAAALIGGGRIPRPGEISLAHNGVLFLDELPEFDRRALECLREPLEMGQVSVARAAATHVFPARFQLVAAMNPCPCGYDGDKDRHCRCTAERIERYRARISGPLAERIDMHLEMPRQALKFGAASKPAPECSATVAARVAQVRDIQMRRQHGLNASLRGRELDAMCTMDRDAEQLLDKVSEQFAMSARASHKILKLARTLADMQGLARIDSNNIAESLTLRALDRGRGSA